MLGRLRLGDDVRKQCPSAAMDRLTQADHIVEYIYKYGFIEQDKYRKIKMDIITAMRNVSANRDWDSVMDVLFSTGWDVGALSKTMSPR